MHMATWPAALFMRATTIAMLFGMMPHARSVVDSSDGKKSEETERFEKHDTSIGNMHASTV